MGDILAGPPGAGARTIPRPHAIEQIWRAEYDSGDLVDVRALTVSGEHSDPRWNPAGTRIAFVGNGAITTMNARGTGRRVVVASGGAQPAWDSGAGIAFVKPATGAGDIYSVSSRGGAHRRLTRDGAGTCGNVRPAFSADGRYFAYVKRVKANGSCRSPIAQVKLVDRRAGTVRTFTEIDLNGES